MKYIGLLLSLFFIKIVWAQSFPNGCSVIPIRDHSLILSADKPTIVILHNISNSDIWVTHPVAEASASAGWSSRLQPANWSALALNEKGFEISCVESKPGHEQQVPCASVLGVCHYVNVKSTEPATSTFWIAENLDLSAINVQIAQRGFTLPVENIKSN
ncbi:Enhanced entry protein EnhB (plasmid) [Legionella adelaidensis]|uniref:Enhanced entry protein EnhB n=1 Tax=Legionella adelaidensis TaxID=45056 RepID=A0A0W0R186_9GAMM|nr:hypothetical protein [Legionella adelaidensis]KTC64766.1 hypothetical protein Lade_2060 [Legionella adelaidensis]VEH81342.1 Enhanced entry protein EnhB [Legionella adelaidensis]